MEFTKDNIRDKIIPSLFYTRDSMSLIPECKKYLKENSIKISGIKEDFNRLSKIEDLEFWKRFVKIFNECFDSKITLEKIENKKSLIELLNDLIKIRFDKIFNERDIDNFSNNESLNLFVNKEKEDKEAIIFEDRNFVKIIKPYEINENRNIAPNTPGKNKSFPNLLIKVNKEDNSFFIDGSQNKINNYKLNILNENEGVFEEKEIVSFEKFNIDVRNFFEQLRSYRMSVRQIKFLNPILFFNVKAKKAFYEVDKIIDSKIYLTNPLDFINIKELKLQYSTNIANESKQFDFNIKIERIKPKDNQEYIKFMINFLGDLRENIFVQNKIIESLRKIGLDEKKNYNFPVDYYFNYMIDSKKFSEYSYKRILKIDEDNGLIKDLINKKIISDERGKFSFNRKEFDKYFLNLLKNLKGKKVSNGEDFDIIDFVEEKNRIHLVVRIFNRENKKEEFYKVYFGEDIRQYYSSITDINFKGENIYFLVNNLLSKKYKKIINYLSEKVHHYIKYEYSEVLLREANNAHSWLNDDYCKNKKSSKEETELGKFVEEKSNIILKYLYRNYISLGGPNKPDGYLYFQYLEDSETIKKLSFLIDSKMHRNISKNEVSKQFSYKNFSKEQNFPEAKGSILIVGRKKIGTSLNEKAQETWKKIVKGFEIYFVSLEFFLAIFELFGKPWVKQNGILRDKILKSFLEIIEEKINFDNKSDKLIEIEDKILNNLQQEINRHKKDYLSQEQNEF